MLHTITKPLEICIDINIEISKVDHYTWIYTFLQMVYEFLNTVSTKFVEFSATAQRIRLE